MIEERLLESRDNMVFQLVNDIASLLEEAVASRGHALFLVSGGSSPKPIYQQLSQRDLPWSKITIALVDERWVAPDHEASNERFIRESLIQKKAAKANFVGMKTDAVTLAEGLRACENRYQALSEQADVCLLGMGTDGHTASLFPNAAGLGVALATASRCAAIEAKQSEVTGAYTQRISLTLSYILASRCRLLVISGSDKFEVYSQAKDGDSVAAMPVRAVLNTEQPPLVYWAP